MTMPYLTVSPSDPNREKKLTDQILADFQSRYGLDISRDPAAASRISEAIKRALLQLETQPEAEIDLPFISANHSGPIHLKWKVVRGDLPTQERGTLDVQEDDIEPEQPRVRILLPERKPFLTTALLVIMALIYALQWLTIFLYGSDLPAAAGMKVNELIIAGQYWRLVTAMFLHGSIIHLGFNLYALYILGQRIERFFGPIRFAELFLIAGITGNLFSFLLTKAPSLGSSTAIFGLLGAEAIFIVQHRDLLGDQYQQAIRQIAQVALVNLVIGFLVPGIDNWGHIGGLIGGAAFTWFGGPIFELSKQPPVIKMEDQRAEIRSGAVFVILLALIAALTAWLVSR
jgi:rhomboid protease GluP